MKECMGDDGETYYEVGGMWYRKIGDKMESCSKPKILIACKIVNQNKDTDFFTKHLVKNKGEK